MDTWSDSCRQPRILSLDGGGIRSKSSLLILDDIMNRLCERKVLREVPRPCDCFDLIGGTGTGGIIAIMLGRLGMTLNECIGAYDQLCQAAFTPKQRTLWRSNHTLSTTALETAIKQVIRANCTHSECAAKRSKNTQNDTTCTHHDLLFRDGSCTKTVILATMKANIDTPPTLFKTYGTCTSYKDCSIWQVARAASATTDVFKPIALGRDKIEFMDSGLFGFNNPTKVLIEEAEKQFPGRGQPHILSIGTGLERVATIQGSRGQLLKVSEAMAAVSRKVSRELDNQYEDGGQYYRFDVNCGLEDIAFSDHEKAGQIAAHTGNYLQENQRAIQKFVDDFCGQQPVPELHQLPPPYTANSPT